MWELTVFFRFLHITALSTVCFPCSHSVSASGNRHPTCSRRGVSSERILRLLGDDSSQCFLSPIQLSERKKVPPLLILRSKSNPNKASLAGYRLAFGTGHLAESLLCRERRALYARLWGVALSMGYPLQNTPDYLCR